MSCYFPRPAFEYIEISTGEIFYKIWRPHVPSSSFPHFFKMLKDSLGILRALDFNHRVRALPISFLGRQENILLMALGVNLE